VLRHRCGDAQMGRAGRPVNPDHMRALRVQEEVRKLKWKFTASSSGDTQQFFDLLFEF
jgi:hypothetical protein